ncbi:putative antitoxin of toxin-antitoxin stability system [Lentisphaera araneosa HTCC2155]|uniref:Antitoxin n=1 Tax=Lentisphaera araneosa HTCC2155 TaxID=313628 RepID=A6DHX4_9BACT|nr:type II toxin-antitoxin system Phd/YefM family antitoxin [Lentisphaera araneosa]EDM28628.1 putative antitoxin of toxin-antitoxin stability system [Lentisphaera araneosa HTCC2155]
MKTISVTKARTNLYKLVDAVHESHDPIHITGKRHSAVLISEEDWSSIQETLMLTSIAGITESIKDGLETSVAECSEELDW